MNQTMTQRRELKVAIGSKYQGPSLDRPCLRQLPRHWHLEETKPKPRFMTPDRWVAVAVGLAWLFLAAQGLGWIAS